MRAIRIDKTGLTEVDAPLDEIMELNECWDYFPLDATHDVWVDDEGLFKNSVVLATIGSRSRVPLPAYILGSDGEESLGATISLAAAQRLIAIQGEV